MRGYVCASPSLEPVLFPAPSSPLPCRCILAVVLYFAIGMPIMYYVKGARGIEMIPLVSFWKDFPFLLKVRVGWGSVRVACSIVMEDVAV